MTGSKAVDSLLLFLMAFIAIVFLGKLMLRRAGRSIVKVYPPVSPPPAIIMLPPMYPAPFPPPQQYSGTGYPAAAYPPDYPAVPIDEHQRPSTAARPLSEDEQFDQIVQGFYER